MGSAYSQFMCILRGIASIFALLRAARYESRAVAWVSNAPYREASCALWVKKYWAPNMWRQFEIYSNSTEPFHVKVSAATVNPTLQLGHRSCRFVSSVADPLPLVRVPPPPQSNASPDYMVTSFCTASELELQLSMTHSYEVLWIRLAGLKDGYNRKLLIIFPFLLAIIVGINIPCSSDVD